MHMHMYIYIYIYIYMFDYEERKTKRLLLDLSQNTTVNVIFCWRCDKNQSSWIIPEETKKWRLTSKTYSTTKGHDMFCMGNHRIPFSKYCSISFKHNTVFSSGCTSTWGVWCQSYCRCCTCRPKCWIVWCKEYHFPATRI